MSNILFHPQLTLDEAERIASEQGGRLVWSRGRVRLIKALGHADRAMDPVRQGDFEAARQHIRAARAGVSGMGSPCVA